MNFLKENKFAAITITLLVILNITLLYVFAFPKMMNDYRDKDFNPSSFMANRIGFSQSQLTQYSSLQEAHRAEMRTLQNQINSQRKELFDLLKVEGDHNAKVDSIASTIGKLSMNTEKATYEHFLSIRAICTPEQLVKLDNVFKEAMRKRGYREENNTRQQRDRRSPRSN